MAELATQGVIRCRRINVRRASGLEPTNTLVLTFCLPVVPPTVKIAYESCRVEQYIPSPLRCFKCQGYGHGKDRCSRLTKCANCGQPAHCADGETCTAEPSCVNCGMNHPAYSKDCPRWHREKAIVRLKYTRNISFPEARKAVEATVNSQNGQTYAAKAAKQHVYCVLRDANRHSSCKTYQLSRGSDRHNLANDSSHIFPATLWHSNPRSHSS